MHVLIVEDERKVGDALREGLQAEGYDVTLERTGEAAYYRLLTESFHLVLLDLGLPGRDGLAILESLREKRLKVPVLVLTARDSVQDRVMGLDRGADDYLVKPFAFAELVARMRALLRRGAADEDRRLILTAGSLQLDVAGRNVTVAGRPLDLTIKEFELLEYLLRHEGQVVSREALVCDIWKEPNRSTSLDNVIDVHMARLRRKIDVHGSTCLIHTIRGVGFTCATATDRWPRTSEEPA